MEPIKDTTPRKGPVKDPIGPKIPSKNNDFKEGVDAFIKELLRYFSLESEERTNTVDK